MLIVGEHNSGEEDVMPKSAAYTLIWDPEQDCYTLYEQQCRTDPLLRGEGAAWFAWLAEHASFSFQGKAGQLNLLKEARERGGEGYWYAYHRRGKQMHKKYAGRSRNLTTAHLETLAQTLCSAARSSGAQSETSQSPELLLEPKLRLPRLHASLVERSRLFALLDAGWERKLTLLSAPAGFGKTTLARQWIESRGAQNQIPPVAWVSLDAGDNDPLRFWRYVITACRFLQIDSGQAALSLLSRTSRPPFKSLSLEDLLTAFLNAVSRSPQDGILVLEDYHVIVEPLIHESMALLLDHLPPTLHLIILSRNDPALPLTRLRAGGELCELHAADLRFSAEEIAAFLQQALSCDASTVPIELLQQLDTRLEGWASGLRLFTLALHGNTNRQQIEHALSTFAGSHRTLQDYFVTEVFALQPEPLRHFLLSTSILSRLTPFLCNAVTERKDSEQMLATLDREGLFLEALDEAGQWYRYHALFAEAMRVEARRRLGEDGLRRLSAKASLWYEEHEMLVDAIEAALQAEDMPRTAGLIEQLVERQWSAPGVVPDNIAYEFHTICRWLEQLPETLIQSRPTLCFLYATSLLFVYIMDKPPVKEPLVMERFDWALRMAEEGWSSEGKLHGLANVMAFRAMMSRQRGDFAQAVPCAEKALAWLPERDVMWRAICMGVVAHDAVLKGQVDRARKVALEAYAISEKTGNRPFIRANTILLGMLCFEQGELHMAAEYYRRMMSEAREDDDLDDTAQAALGLSQLSCEWNDLSDAEQQAQEALTISHQLNNYEFETMSTLVLARIEHIRGQVAAAQQYYVSLLARLSPHSMPLQRWLARLTQAMQARVALAVGDHSFVQRWLSNCARDDDHEIPLIVREQEALVEARWLLAQNKEDEALALLARLLDAAQQDGRIRVALEIQVLMALVHAARKQLHEARSLLHTVLAQAAAEGYLRLFLDEGTKLVPLLRSLSPLNEPSFNTYLQTILQAFAQDIQSPLTMPATTSLIEPLSPQELRVLRLLAAARTNREIAGELVVSVNTVRTQVQSIYRKLNVNNRVAASEAARQLHLI